MSVVSMVSVVSVVVYGAYSVYGAYGHNEIVSIGMHEMVMYTRNPNTA